MDKLPSPQRVRVHGSGGRGPEIQQTNHWKRRRQTRCGAKEDMRERKRTTGWSVGEMVKWLFFLLMIGQSLVRVTASSENVPSNRRQMEGMQGERKMKESSWVQINQTNFPTMEMRKESKWQGVLYKLVQRGAWRSLAAHVLAKLRPASIMTDGSFSGCVYNITPSGMPFVLGDTSVLRTCPSLARCCSCSVAHHTI